MDASNVSSNTSSTPMDVYDYDHYYSDGSFDKFAPCDKAHVKHFGSIFLPILYAIVSVLGILGNVLLVFVLIRFIKFKSMASVYLLNISVSDLLFSTTLPFWAVYAHSHWLFGAFGCKAITAVYAANLYSSIFFITCLSLDNYLHIVWAFPNSSLQSMSRRLAMCGVVWTLALVATVPSLVFVKVEDFYDEKLCLYDFGEVHTPAWKFLMKFQLNIVGFLLPFLAMLFFYLRILCVVVKSMGRKFKSLRLALVLVAVFFLLWFPYNLVVFLHSLQDLHVLSDCDTSWRLDYALQATEGLAFVHACLNPLLYAFVNERFRKYFSNAVKNIYRKGMESMEPTEPTGSTSQTVQNVEMELTRL